MLLHRNKKLRVSMAAILSICRDDQVLLIRQSLVFSAADGTPSPIRGADAKDRRKGEDWLMGCIQHWWWQAGTSPDRQRGRFDAGPVS